MWHPWSPEIFAQAAREHKLVLLNLGTGWCHWCRVMDQEIYRDPDVQRLVGKNYIAIKVDQNSRPDISNRYHGYDLPATVMFKADGSEIIRQQGYLSPRQMASILQAVIDDPSPGPSVKPEPDITYATSPSLPSGLLDTLRKSFKTQYDIPAQGWAFGVKYIDGSLYRGEKRRGHCFSRHAISGDSRHRNGRSFGAGATGRNGVHASP